MKRYWKKLMVAGFCLAILLAGALIDTADTAEKTVVSDEKKDADYVPGSDYKGEFIQSRIYYRNPGSAVWRRMSVSDNYRDVVTCSTALTALESSGKWQGHLKQDGSCGPYDEPAHFALGNRINYDISLDQDVSSK